MLGQLVTLEVVLEVRRREPASVDHTPFYYAIRAETTISAAGKTVRFPIQLDDAVTDTNQAWAASLRRLEQ